MKKFTNQVKMLSGTTPEAKSLIKKVKQFNELVAYFKSDEAKEILSKDLNICEGEKYKYGYKDEPATDYVSPSNFRITYNYDNNAVIYADLTVVTTTGKIGKKSLSDIQFNPLTKKSYFDDITLEQIDSNFKPGVKSEHIKSDKVLKLSDDIRWKGLKLIEDSFKELGIESYFVFEHYFLSGSIYAKDFCIKRDSFEKLFLESVKIDVPCMLHENKNEKENFEKLKAEGYLENMIKAKVTEKYNNWCKENNMPLTSMEFNFFGNSLLLFRKAELYIKTKVSENSGMSHGNTFPVKII